MATKKTYDDSSISSLKGADRVRKRPGVIFGSDGLEGCEHAVFEIMSNAIDEAREGHGKLITVTRFMDRSIQVEDMGRGCPVDWNEKEGRYNWELVFCELYAGSQYVRAREKALWYIDYSDISKKGLYGKLRREYGEEISARVSDRMEELGLIDDRRYAERYAEILLGEKRVAPRKAIMMMTAKGIDRETARSALEQVGQDPVGVICELIEKKYISRMHDPDGVRKTVAALARRGFSFSDIREAVKRYNDETEFYEE